MNNTAKIKYFWEILNSGRLRVWIRFYFQRLFLGRIVRAKLSELYIALLRVLRGGGIAKRKRYSIELSKLNESGITMFDNLLSKEQCNELVEYFSTKKVFDPKDNKEAPQLVCDARLDSESHVFYHFPLDVLDAPHLLQVVNSSQILELVESYLGLKPTLGYLAAWWSFPPKDSLFGPENFHRDVDDWRFLKLFIYLTDVNSSTGGMHVYVKHSVNSRFGRNKIRRFSDDEIFGHFGDDNILNIKGPAGLATLEDTFGFHKGSPVMKGERLMFQAVYSIDTLPYSPKQPILKAASIPMVVDKFVNRSYLD